MALTEKNLPVPAGGATNGQHLLSKADLNPLTGALYLANLLWCFTKSDVPTTIVPCVTFGLLGALSGPAATTNPDPDPRAVLSRLPSVAFFIWFNCLAFNLANQRLPDSVLEDSMNKPSRPLPSGLITSAQTRRLLLGSIPVFLAVSYAMGVWRETALLCILDWMYNELKGGDEDFIVRNLIIGAAFAAYHEGALLIACGPDHHPATSGLVWTAIVSGVMFSTIHVQDLKDQAGDRAKGRRSAPIVLGDGIARWTVAIPVAFWSIFCPRYWQVPPLWWAVPIVPGFVVAFRVLWLRDHDADRNTWILWACWLTCLYLMPVLEDPIAALKWPV